MPGATASGGLAEDRLFDTGAAGCDQRGRAGPSTWGLSTCLVSAREQHRAAGSHAPRATPDGVDGGHSCGGDASDAGIAGSDGPEPEAEGSSVSPGVSQGSSYQAPACHGCRAPWHPGEGRCAVPRTGPEDRARWRLWSLQGRADHSSGRAPGSQRALRLAQTHTIVCGRCGDLVPLQQARTAARGARRAVICAGDGCYGCGRHGRKSRRAERQGGMAMAILAGRRVLLEVPPSAAARVELWMLPRSDAEARARGVLARYQPQGLGRWLTHSCQA